MFRHVARSVALTVALTAAASATGPAAPASAAPRQGFSGAWSGLVAGAPGGGFTQVTADVTVPRVSLRCGAGSNVAVFVGIGGWGSVPFAQAGFTVTPRGGIGVWSEVFDRAGRGPVTSVRLAVRPGDRVRISVAFSPLKYYLWFRWINLTTHRATAQTVTNAFRYYGGGTADFVVERSWYPYRGSPLAGYSPVAFSNARGLARGRWVPAYGPRSTVVTALGARGNTVSRVSAARGTSMTTAWAACS